MSGRKVLRVSILSRCTLSETFQSQHCWGIDEYHAIDCSLMLRKIKKIDHNMIFLVCIPPVPFSLNCASICCFTFFKGTAIYTLHVVGKSDSTPVGSFCLFSLVWLLSNSSTFPLCWNSWFSEWVGKDYA